MKASVFCVIFIIPLLWCSSLYSDEPETKEAESSLFSNREFPISTESITDCSSKPVFHPPTGTYLGCTITYTIEGSKVEFWREASPSVSQALCTHLCSSEFVKQNSGS